MRIRRGILTGIVGLAALCASVVAQESPSGANDAGSGTHGSRKAHSEFGTVGVTVVNVPSFAFQGNEPMSDQIVQDGSFFRYFSANGSHAMIAPVVGIPSGVVIDGITANNCSALDHDMTFVLWLGDWDGSLPGGPVQIGSVDSTQGCGVDEVIALNHLYNSNSAGPLFAEVFFNASNIDGSDKFDGFQVAFHRIVSPAPGTATFDDVPTSHPFFQFIEALAASGITGGCGNGNYCPDAPLTRGQMAVFLSKALGLHWPD
jgi:hypothetical protein